MYPFKKRRGPRKTQTHRKSPVKMGQEIVVTLPQTKGGQEPPEGARNEEGLTKGLERAWPLLTP